MTQVFLPWWLGTSCHGDITKQHSPLLESSGTCMDIEDIGIIEWHSYCPVTHRSTWHGLQIGARACPTACKGARKADGWLWPPLSRLMPAASKSSTGALLSCCPALMSAHLQQRWYLAPSVYISNGLQYVACSNKHLCDTQIVSRGLCLPLAMPEVGLTCTSPTRGCTPAFQVKARSM